MLVPRKPKPPGPKAIERSMAIGCIAFAAALLCAAGTATPAMAGSFHFLPLFPPASNPSWEGFARIINHSDFSGTVRITGFDDEGTEHGPIVLSLEARETAHFNSEALEEGDSAKGLADGLGDGMGDWRLHLETDLDIETLSYVRTRDGFVTAMHEVVPAEGMRHHVRFFNPGSNRGQVSRLRLINASAGSVEVTITGRDDDGNPAPGGAVRLVLGEGAARTLTAQELEANEGRTDGSLGDGAGKWQLFVTADGPIHVMSVLRSPTGHLSNLSTRGTREMDDPLEVDPELVELLAGPVKERKSVGLFAAIVDGDGVREIGVEGLRKVDSPLGITVNDLVRINSNTKAMTSTMLATLVEDGTFSRGWRTTIVDVFPELRAEVHEAYNAVTLRQLVTMAGGIKRDASDWWDHWGRDIVETRYEILRENLSEEPIGPRGEFFYSNLGYMVAGAMAERVTGKSWETLMEERIFAPLGIAGARFGPVGTFHNVDQPWGHWLRDGAYWVPRRYGDGPAWGPAATVNVSIGEWAKFMRLWFPEVEPVILDRETLDELVTPDSGTYAAGWGVVERRWAGGVAFNHTGASCCWRTTLWIAPNRGVAYVAAANSRDRDDDIKDILDSIILSLIRHESSRAAGLEVVTRNDVLAPDWDGLTQFDPVEQEVRLPIPPL